MQVLNTLQQADNPAPESRGFFTPIALLWSGKGLIQHSRKRGIRQPSCCGVQVPDRLFITGTFEQSTGVKNAYYRKSNNGQSQ
jgi:hypothetical protein